MKLKYYSLHLLPEYLKLIHPAESQLSTHVFENLAQRLKIQAQLSCA